MTALPPGILRAIGLRSIWPLFTGFVVCLALAVPGLVGGNAISPALLAAQAFNPDDRLAYDHSDRAASEAIRGYDDSFNRAGEARALSGPVPAARGVDEAVDVAGQGFRSFSSFKRAQGRAGPGKQWHHIVEQTPGNVSRFGPEAKVSPGATNGSRCPGRAWRARTSPE